MLARCLAAHQRLRSQVGMIGKEAIHTQRRESGDLISHVAKRGRVSAAVELVGQKDVFSSERPAMHLHATGVGV